ncbi:RrF2 family transcriptional regulator [Novosphingobium marinum]|uniref:Rrf2 family nitric oxide-sensitive transcriptional repressor n=1 Tax=Novosphingobium marinum TaxID=1514948 RepID=A0A7Y9Y1F1_9SPHN|nr:Rrf2 family transcriptional regulator [Novosphingobium marinum]NYH97200.1 Rrf2 family nitric oxide-sensitive transcriptional repressor [Novosphingobium marinum]
MHLYSVGKRCKQRASYEEPIIRLTLHTDYALRILLHAAARDGERLSISAVAEQHGISRNHVMKVINHLANLGLLRTARGPGGGFWLARDPESISLGEVVRKTEPTLKPADCGSCVLNYGCGLQPILQEAVKSFLAVLDTKSLADALADSRLDFSRLPASSDGASEGTDLL